MGLRKSLVGLRSLSTRLAHNRRGIAAVEFALIVPAMIALYLGGMEISEGVSTYRQVDLTANTVTNLVAQYTTISASQTMPDILNAAVQVMYPNTSTSTIVTVSFVSIDKNGNATVTWSKSLNGTARTTGSAVTVPSSLDTANTALVLGEVTFPYAAAIDFLKLGTINLSSSIFMIPRAATVINLTT